VVSFVPFIVRGPFRVNRLPLFPDTVALQRDELTIGGSSLTALAEEYGTPLYLYDKATLGAAALAYQRLLGEHYPGPAGVTYAGKAFLSVAIARWTQTHGLTVDCTGEGEIAMAAAAGVPREKLLVHGVNKSAADLLAAIQHAGTLVVDNLTELERLVSLGRERQLPALWLRFQPGIAVETHTHTQTGQSGSKFGLGAEDLLAAARLCRENSLPLTGIHFHQGSQFTDPSPLGIAIQRAADLAAEIGFEAGWHFSPGGGWGVAYHEDDLPHPPLEAYVRYVCEKVLQACARADLALPVLHLEPGRTLVARAGVAVYRVGAVKRTAQRTWLLVDGGMTDNPRHALYGVRYSALPVSAPAREAVERVWVAGPFCESGDVLIEDLPFPRIEEGELLAVPMAGAYHLSMSSNYNGARRPAVVMLENGSATLMQRRETAEDLLRRDVM
jgi:diaminopimelate decarboxylase